MTITRLKYKCLNLLLVLDCWNRISIEKLKFKVEIKQAHRPWQDHFEESWQGIGEAPSSIYVYFVNILGLF